MSEIVIAILPSYSTYSITSEKRDYRLLQMADIFKMSEDLSQLYFDIRYEKIIPNYVRKSGFHGDDVINYITVWPECCPC